MTLFARFEYAVTKSHSKVAMSSTLGSMLLQNISSKTFSGRMGPSLQPTMLHENFLKYVTTFEITISLVYYALLMIIIVSGNVLVITAYSKNWRLHTTTNTFILGLAAADLLVGFFSIPLWLYVYSCNYFDIILKPVAYDAYITLDIFIGCASIFQLTAISLERCIAIVWPIKHRGISLRSFHMMIVVAWSVSALMGGLYLIQLKKWENGYTAFVFSVSFAGPFVLLFGVYVLIYNTAIKSRTRVRCEYFSATLRREIRVTGTVALVTGVFMMAWLPFFVVTVVATYELERLPNPPDLLRLVAFVKALHYTNSGLNPMIYAYRNSEMGKTMRSIASSCFPLGKLLKSRSRESSHARHNNSANTTLPANNFLLQNQSSKRGQSTPSTVTSVTTFLSKAGGGESRPPCLTDEK